jgi:hypothetical protein
MYKPGGTIKSLLTDLEQHIYVLPAIQREFVWSAEQICRLFDSLMQGYPFGTMLFWNINPENSDKFKFFDFVRTYHERDNPHCPPLPIQYNKPLVAVLDGQQRMTALNIGLRGSYAEKVKWKWWSSPDAFPTKRMYLNLLSEANFETDDKFEFVFREDGLPEHEAKSLWFPVGEILGLSGGPDMQDWIEKFELQKEQRKTAYRTLDMLYRVIHTDQLISYYEERNQDIERVLSIFIRINSGGTKLSYSDLLLSVAVAQWQTLDARDEIHKVVDEMNSIGSRFNFSKDLVLKAGLMLADIGNVGFKVANFTHENMTTLEAKWKGIRKALVLATHLLSSFGFNGQVLRADSALLPIAYYLYIRKFGDSYLTDNKYVDDRHEIRQWLVKTLLKSSGIWGGGLDTFLGRLRDVINNHGDSGFPIHEIVSEMNKSGKSLTFEQEEMEDLLDVQYGQPLTFSVLSLLFPHLDLSHHFHIDHVYPKSKLVRRELEALGFSVAEIDLLGEMANKLPNLQLLQGAINVQKQAQSPAQWADNAFTDAQRPAYVSTNMLGTLPRDPKGFEDFFNARRNLLQQRLSALLA